MGKPFPYLDTTTADGTYAARAGVAGVARQFTRLKDRPSVMASAPTITKGSAGGASTIASSVLIQSCTDSRLASIRGGTAATKAIQFGGTPVYYNNTQGCTSTLDQKEPWTFDFMHYGAKFEIQIAATSPTGWLQIYVEDQAVSASVITESSNSGSGYKYLVDFGSAAARQISVTIGGLSFGGLYVGPTDTVWALARPRLTRALFLGDSFTAGSAATNTSTAYPLEVGSRLGWDDVWFSGQAGTGYLNNGGGSGGRTTFRSRVATDIAPYTPDKIVVYGGTNDVASAPSAVQAEAVLLYNAIKAACPNADLYVVGIQYPSGAADATRDAIDAALLAACTSVGTSVVKGYISAKTWFTGTGRVGATTGSGNSDIFTSSDALHPTDAGHQYIANRIASGIAALL